MLKKLQELIEQKAYAEFRKEVLELNDADVASVVTELEKAEQLKIFRILPKNIAADVFSYLPIETQQDILVSLTDKEASGIIENLYADDAADLLEEMPANVVHRLLALTSPETRRDINNLLQYPDDSAGSIMTVEYIDLKEETTVAQAIEKIRTTGIDKETINNCFVLDRARHLIGIVTLRKLLLSHPDELVQDVMTDNVISVKTLTDQEEVARIVMKYDFTVVPVVDSENRMVGIVTVDDVVDIIEQEATEDIEKVAAITPTDKPYMRMGVLETFWKRIPWLMLLMLSAAFTGSIITSFESALAKQVVLTAFIPMLMGTGGNAGGQASVTIIRGLSLDEIRYRDIFRVLWKEFRVAICCGIVLAGVNFVKLLFLDRVGMMVAVVVSLSLIATVVIAKLMGCSLPVLAKRIGVDPAVMASPFITTIVDTLSLVIYFKIATMLLGL